MNTKQLAIAYIKDMSFDDKQKLKKMLSFGVFCGKDFAIENEVEPIIFNAELKSIMGVKQ